MYTSAQALNELLTALSRRLPGTDRVASVLAVLLELEGTDVEGEAIIRLRRLVLKLQEDIRSVPTEESNRKLLEKSFSPFHGIISFSHLHFTLDDAKKNWLKGDNLVGLNYIHMVLDAKMNYSEASVECAELLSSIDEIREQLAESEIGDEVRKIIDLRLSQVRSVLAHFKYFGVDELETHLSSLIGQIVLSSAEIKKGENRDLLSKIIRILNSVVSIILKTSTTATSLRITFEAGKKIIGFLDGESNES